MSNGEDESESNNTIIIDGPNKAPMTVFYVLSRPTRMATAFALA